jgi:type I restriction enzyme M protein
MDRRADGQRGNRVVPRITKRTTSVTTSATLGFEAKLWAAANALRGSMDGAEYRHVVLGLIFLKYISDAFEACHGQLEAERDQGADPEDPDEYRAENIFWVPPEARWSHLQKKARQPAIGELVDQAMTAVERDNPSPRGVLRKEELATRAPIVWRWRGFGWRVRGS